MLPAFLGTYVAATICLPENCERKLVVSLLNKPELTNSFATQLRPRYAAHWDRSVDSAVYRYTTDPEGDRL